MDGTRESPGFRFVDGSLEITSENRRMKLCGWPEPRAVHSENGVEWKEFRPPFRVIYPDPILKSESFSEEQYRALTAFRESLPHYVSESVGKFESYQWNPIDLLYRCREALDLFYSNPVLAHCLANNDEFVPGCRKAPAVYAMEQVAKRQRDIAGWLGFPGKEAIVRILRKIPPEISNPHQGRLLRRAINDAQEVVKLLSHSEYINEGVLALVTNLKLLPLISPNFLSEVSKTQSDADGRRAGDMLVDALYLFQQLGRHNRIPRFDGIEAMRSFYEDVLHDVRKREEALLDLKTRDITGNHASTTNAAPRKRRAKVKHNPPFPGPPVSGIPEIIPLRSKTQIESEGIAQRNCVGSYVRDVIAGRKYIYAVLFPQRATLSISPQNGFWAISELEAANNKPARLATQYFVEQWLLRQQKPA